LVITVRKKVLKKMMQGNMVLPITQPKLPLTK
jgi:hypothetical protein